MARIAVRISVTVAVAIGWALLTLLSPIGTTQPQPGAATAEIREANGQTLTTAELREDHANAQVALVLRMTEPS